MCFYRFCRFSGNITWECKLTRSLICSCSSPTFFFSCSSLDFSISSWVSSRTWEQTITKSLQLYNNNIEGDSASGHPQHQGGDSFHCCPECFITQPFLIVCFFFLFFFFSLKFYWTGLSKYKLQLYSQIQCGKSYFFHNAILTHNIRKVLF